MLLIFFINGLFLLQSVNAIFLLVLPSQQTLNIHRPFSIEDIPSLLHYPLGILVPSTPAIIRPLITKTADLLLRLCWLLLFVQFRVNSTYWKPNILFSEMGACVTNNTRKRAPQNNNLAVKPPTSVQSQHVIADTSITRPYRNLFKTFSDGDQLLAFPHRPPLQGNKAQMALRNSGKPRQITLSRDAVLFSNGNTCQRKETNNNGEETDYSLQQSKPKGKQNRGDGVGSRFK